MTLVQELYTLSLGIASYLKSWLENSENRSYRMFYGEAFILALLQAHGELNELNRDDLFARFGNKDRGDPEFHWEFNNYAMIEYYFRSGDEKANEYLIPLKFKYTPCTNWTLLRCNTKARVGEDIGAAIKEAKCILKKRQFDSGLISDEPGVRSFQYHSFSLVMIGELYEKTGEKFFLERFCQGITFIRNYIMPNGDFNYIGRGQCQLFGYASLIYALAMAFTWHDDAALLGDCKAVMCYLKRFRRDDGSLPLVLNGLNGVAMSAPDMMDESLVGWYPYNNLYDYLPFAGLFITKAAEVLKGKSLPGILLPVRKSYRDSDFIVIHQERYGAVIGRTGGYWTNDMPSPYVVIGGNNVTSCYGGEQFQKSLYSLRGIPLPYWDFLSLSIRKWSLSFLYGNWLVVLSLFGIMIRRYVFEETVISMSTAIYSLIPFKHQYLVPDDYCMNGSSRITGRLCWFESDRPLDFAGTQYSASGRLNRFTARGRKNTIKLLLL